MLKTHLVLYIGVGFNFFFCQKFNRTLVIIALINVAKTFSFCIAKFIVNKTIKLNKRIRTMKKNSN